MPEGALAVGRGGFEVRCLDRVHPLLSSELLHKALALLGDGREKEAASVLRLEPADSPCVRAFCRELCARLHVPPTERLGGGSVLSASACERLENGLVRPSAGLPARVVVVQAGTGVSLERTSAGQPLCPSDLVDREFADGDELNALLPEPLVTCAPARACARARCQ